MREAKGWGPAGGGEEAGGQGAGPGAEADGRVGVVVETHLGVGAKGDAAGEGIRGPRRGGVGLWVRSVAPGDAGPAQGVRSCRESTGARQSRARSPGARGRGRH